MGRSFEARHGEAMSISSPASFFRAASSCSRAASRGLTFASSWSRAASTNFTEASSSSRAAITGADRGQLFIAFAATTGAQGGQLRWLAASSSSARGGAAKRGQLLLARRDECQQLGHRIGPGGAGADGGRLVVTAGPRAGEAGPLRSQSDS